MSSEEGRVVGGEPIARLGVTSFVPGVSFLEPIMRLLLSNAGSSRSFFNASRIFSMVNTKNKAAKAIMVYLATFSNIGNAHGQEEIIGEERKEVDGNSVLCKQLSVLLHDGFFKK